MFVQKMIWSHMKIYLLSVYGKDLSDLDIKVGFVVALRVFAGAICNPMVSLSRVLRCCCRRRRDCYANLSTRLEDMSELTVRDLLYSSLINFLKFVVSLVSSFHWMAMFKSANEFVFLLILSSCAGCN